MFLYMINCDKCDYEGLPLTCGNCSWCVVNFNASGWLDGFICSFPKTLSTPLNSPTAVTYLHENFNNIDNNNNE